MCLACILHAFRTRLAYTLDASYDWQKMCSSQLSLVTALSWGFALAQIRLTSAPDASHECSRRISHICSGHALHTFWTCLACALGTIKRYLVLELYHSISFICVFIKCIQMCHKLIYWRFYAGYNIYVVVIHILF